MSEDTLYYTTEDKDQKIIQWMNYLKEQEDSPVEPVEVDQWFGVLNDEYLYQTPEGKVLITPSDDNDTHKRCRDYGWYIYQYDVQNKIEKLAWAISMVPSIVKVTGISGMKPREEDDYGY